MNWLLRTVNRLISIRTSFSMTVMQPALTMSKSAMGGSWGEDAPPIQNIIVVSRKCRGWISLTNILMSVALVT